jgi:hypothetical protein
MFRGNRLVSSLVAASLAGGALSACGSSDSAQSGPGLSCTNYALHGTGNYHNEVSVQVKVSNSAPRPARYAVDVTLTAGHDGPQDAAATRVTIYGWVPSHASSELGRKVLTAGTVQSCRVTGITQLGPS